VNVYNLTSGDVIVKIANSRPKSPSIGPEFPVTIPSGGKLTWKISRKAGDVYLQQRKCGELRRSDGVPRH
jgi:hypothetical protein